MSIDLAHSSAVISGESDCAILPAYKDMEERAVLSPKRKKKAPLKQDTDKIRQSKVVENEGRGM